MIESIKHIYIHIPFCKSICEYCDFIRCIANSKTQDEYIEKIIREINSYKQKFKTIYIGGGTPNSLSHENLEKLLISLQKNISTKTEFSIECNPEFISDQQADMLSKYKINRVSIGAQTSNNKILGEMGRKHKIKDVVMSLKNLEKANIFNISLDFIYGFNGLNISDLKETIDIINENKIPHVSFYSLELKENSKLSQKKYRLDDEKIENQLFFIQKQMKNIGFTRYEVSNWAKSKKYFCKHNLCYWQSKDWIGVGYGAFGFENGFYYENIGNLSEWKKSGTKQSKQELYFQIIMMGLRQTNGINISKGINNEAYLFFKNKLNTDKIIITKNMLRAKKINLLNDLLIDIV